MGEPSSPTPPCQGLPPPDPVCEAVSVEQEGDGAMGLPPPDPVCEAVSVQKGADGSPPDLV
ncbi:hypothetical protein GCM10023096_29460 [Nonomuraea ferruginea]